MSRVVRIAVAQVAAGWPEGGSPAEIRAHHKKGMEPMMAKAAKAGADILCFCENALTTGIKAPPDARDVWQDVVNGPDMRWAAEQAARGGFNLIMPTVGYSNGALRNVAVVLGRQGQVIGVYEKVHLGKKERERITAGGSWPVFQLDVGKIGVMICHDMHFPEAPRCLALNGAEIIFWPTHFGAIWGDDYCMALIRAAAIHNGVFFAPVSLAPKPGEAWMAHMQLARSGLVGPRGEWLFSAGFGVGLAIGEIDLDEPLDRPWFGFDRHDEYREHYLADRRPDTYGRLTER